MNSELRPGPSVDTLCVRDRYPSQWLSVSSLYLKEHRNWLRGCHTFAEVSEYYLVVQGGFEVGVNPTLSKIHHRENIVSQTVAIVEWA